MATDYPIEITDPDGSVRLAGLADFTDQDNQPGGPPPTAIESGLNFGTQPSYRIAGVVSVDLANVIKDGGLSATSPPQVIGAASAVCSVLGIQVCNVPDISDVLDVAGNLFVTDLTGTNTLAVQATGSHSTPIGPDGFEVDWTGTSATITGVDLSWDDTTGTVTSTAGGVFAGSLAIQCGGD